MENEIKFADYCCFGKRQSGLLFETTDGITAVYEMFGIRVHELSSDRKKVVWTLTKYAPDGRRTRLTFNSTLDKAICNHTVYLDNEKNELLGLLRQELRQFGPVWLAPLPSFDKGEKSIVYAPAGKLLAVRLLLSAGGEYNKHLKALKGLLEYHDPDLRLNLKMHDFYETSLVITRDNGSSYWHMAFVAEYVVPHAGPK